MTTFGVLPEQLEIQIYAGDSFRARLDRRNQAGNTIDTTGTLLAEIKAAGDPSVLTTFTIEDDNAANGTIYISLTPAQTRLLGNDVLAPYFTYDIQVTYSSGNVETFLSGIISVIHDVTGSFS